MVVGYNDLKIMLCFLADKTVQGLPNVLRTIVGWNNDGDLDGAIFIGPKL